MIRRWIEHIVDRAVAATQHDRALDALHRVNDVAQALAAEKAVNAELRVMLAQARANFDWLATRMHEIHLERAQLYERLGVHVPVPEIARTGAAMPAPDNYTPPSNRPVGDVLAMAREILDPKNKPASLADLTELSFEDVGDDAAATLGL
jgi:hypothetical protein